MNYIYGAVILGALYVIANELKRRRTKNKEEKIEQTNEEIFEIIDRIIAEEATMIAIHGYDAGYMNRDKTEQAFACFVERTDLQPVMFLESEKIGYPYPDFDCFVRHEIGYKSGKILLHNHYDTVTIMYWDRTGLDSVSRRIEVVESSTIFTLR